MISKNSGGSCLYEANKESVSYHTCLSHMSFELFSACLTVKAGCSIIVQADFSTILILLTVPSINVLQSNHLKRLCICQHRLRFLSYSCSQPLSLLFLRKLQWSVLFGRCPLYLLLRRTLGIPFDVLILTPPDINGDCK